MAQKSKQWAAIIMMIALFAMIAFVTNLCSPMAVIVQNQFGASELQSQIGNYANFVAYLVMGNKASALFTFVVPFLISTCGGTIIAIIITLPLKKSGMLGKMKESLEE